MTILVTVLVTVGLTVLALMLRAIRSANRTITFETYIYWSGQVGKEFAEALAERARTIASKVPRSPSCRRRSWTTG